MVLSPNVYEPPIMIGSAYIIILQLALACSLYQIPLGEPDTGTTNTSKTYCFTLGNITLPSNNIS